MLIIRHHLPTSLSLSLPYNYTASTNIHHQPTYIQTEKADSIRNNGCFDSGSLVETPEGQVQISQLQTNDLVLTMNSLTGQLQFSPFLMWLDRDDDAEELFVELTTKSNRVIRLTSSHLIYLADEPIDLMQSFLSTKTTTPPPPQSLGAADTLPPVLADTGSHDNNEHNSSSNLYYNYAIDDGTNESSSNSDGHVGGGKTNGSTSATVDVVDQAAPKVAPSLPRGQQRPPTIDEIAYTTYARNSLVGQYLLINDEPLTNQVDDDASSGDNDDDDRQTNIIARPDLDEAARNRYSILNHDRPANRIVIHSRKSPPQVRLQRGPTVKFDQIVSVNFVTRSGRFAPLTREGNIVVNSVVASCYAVISDHDMAHLSFAPVRWLSYLHEWLFGFEQPSTARELSRQERLSEPMSPVYDIQRLTKLEPNRRIRLEYSARLGTNSMVRHQDGVHWYPQLLYRIARLILPTRYLY